MNPTQDQSIISLERVLSGDKDAFRDLVKSHQRLVETIVSRIIANDEDRRDLCQDIFVKVYERLDQFQRGSKLSTWIARVAINTCLHHVEKKRVPLYEDQVRDDSTVDDCEAQVCTPHRFTEDRQTAIRLSEEIDRLPVVWGTILTLYHLQEMTYAEIAGIMKLPEGTVKSYLFRARQLLKERLTVKYAREDLCA
jgi:RNA polymerase sigma-70 factor (ECF subfamily)